MLGTFGGGSARGFGMGAGSGSLILSGGTLTTDGDFNIMTFTSSGTLTVSKGGSAIILAVAGGGSGGGGGAAGGGGGGAGGLAYSSEITLSVGSYTVTIGAGGATPSKNIRGNNGSDTILQSFVTVKGGGGGGGATSGTANTGGGGGGGGGVATSGPNISGGSGILIFRY